MGISYKGEKVAMRESLCLLVKVLCAELTSNEEKEILVLLPSGPRWESQNTTLEQTLCFM